MRAKHSVGAATLLIHIEAKQATPICINSTKLGFVPARLRILVAMITSIRVLLSAAAMVKPPMRSMIVEVNIWEKMNLQESGRFEESGTSREGK